MRIRFNSFKVRTACAVAHRVRAYLMCITYIMIHIN